MDRNPQAFKLAAKHYTQQMRQDWRILLPGFLLPAIGGVLVFYAPPLIIARVLSYFGQQNHPRTSDFIPYVLLFAAVWAAGEISWRIGFHFIIKAEVRGARRLFLQAMNYLLEKDLGFFHDNFAGSLTKKVNDYGWRYIEIVDTLMYNVFSMYLPIIFAVFILWHFSPWLVVTLVGLLTITGAFVFPLIKRRMHIVSLREKAHNVMSGHIADSIGNADTVKAFANEPLEIQTYEKFVNDFIEKAKWSWDYQNLRINVTTSPFYVLTNTLGLLLALTLSHGNSTTLETVFVSFSYFSATTRVVWEFSDTYRRLEASLTEAAQFTILLLEEPKLKDIDQPQTLEVTEGHIQMKDVSFKYHDRRGDHLFEHFNLDIKSGQKVALVGHSGGGKTTITRLLMRFMDINQGEILIDGQNIAHVKQADLRHNIAYVPQEPTMFHRSLMDNIRYGRLDATDEEVSEAARLAHAEEFIEKLADGYDTLVGERGVKLSGGQRQRVAIARAILKNAPILILDEATSSLDSESEKLIQDALWRLMEGRTTIVIAHRLSTIQRMDRIVVLEEGQIVEQASHRELLDHGGVYANLWAHQSGGFLEDNGTNRRLQ